MMIPYGMADFVSIKVENKYYIDKSEVFDISYTVGN